MRELLLDFSGVLVTVHCPMDGSEDAWRSVNACISCPHFRWFGRHPVHKDSTGQRVPWKGMEDTSAHHTTDLGIRLQYLRCAVDVVSTKGYEGILDYETKEV